MLPNEAEKEIELTEKLADDFDRVKKFIQFAVDVITRRQPADGMLTDSSSIAYKVGHGLCIKGCKSLRGIHALCRLGLGQDADVLQRTLFETSMAASFVLRANITLGLSGVVDSELTSEFRAKLYLAYHAIKKLDSLEAHRDSPEKAKLLEQITPRNLAIIEENAQYWENDIGDGWPGRFRNRPWTYSGLTIKRLADCLGDHFPDWYDVVYREQSAAAHATDLLKHAKWQEDEGRLVAVWHTNADAIRMCLNVSGTMLWSCLKLLDEQFKFEYDTSTELDGFLVEFGIASRI